MCQSGAIQSIYVFKKYNFFNIYISDIAYIHLDRFLITEFIKDAQLLSPAFDGIKYNSIISMKTRDKFGI